MMLLIRVCKSKCWVQYSVTVIRMVPAVEMIGKDAGTQSSIRPWSPHKPPHPFLPVLVKRIDEMSLMFLELMWLLKSDTKGYRPLSWMGPRTRVSLSCSDHRCLAVRVLQPRRQRELVSLPGHIRTLHWMYTDSEARRNWKAWNVKRA